jgi:hypothetical protein
LLETHLQFSNQTLRSPAAWQGFLFFVICSKNSWFLGQDLSEVQVDK